MTFGHIKKLEIHNNECGALEKVAAFFVKKGVVL